MKSIKLIGLIATITGSIYCSQPESEQPSLKESAAQCMPGGCIKPDRAKPSSSWKKTASEVATGIADIVAGAVTGTVSSFLTVSPLFAQGYVEHFKDKIAFLENDLNLRTKFAALYDALPKPTYVDGTFQAPYNESLISRSFILNALSKITSARRDFVNAKKLRLATIPLALMGAYMMYTMLKPQD